MNIKSKPTIKPNTIDWDDLKYFLAIAEEGSLSAASRKLSVSQPTLSRRLTTFEETVGAELFSRTRSGLEITVLGEQILARAAHMRDDVHTVERLITGHDTSLQGSVIISCIEIIGAEWLVQKIRPFHDIYPEITVEIKIDNTASDLLRREADIALRMFRPIQNDLVAKRTVSMNYGYYASKDYIEKHGKPETFSELREHRFIMPHDEILAHVNQQKAPKRPLSNVVFRSNNLLALATAVRAGYGIGAYSCLIAEKDPNLVRLFGDFVIFSSDIWLVSHSELRRSARIRAMYDYLGDMLHDHRHQFSGEV
ncbi:LysR family transcriptional regulator [Kordiimonas pumila]|uniref:LysR family transcriptional regulator n=1 Tax=Kordiimonas pumila TaxID=2161677 RepID=A0ABV7D1S1_9PROT|nr:LysR family transcriptional regulator [Kordiimonas pumila]